MRERLYELVKRVGKFGYRGAMLAVLVFGLSPSTGLASERATVTDRIDRIRARAKQHAADTIASATTTGRADATADQWGNWGNWGNWPNWNNWGNWRNWGNWGNA
jgi:hypothetical protein